MTGFAPIAAQYDGFIVDLWGVIHDGIKPFPGVIDCLTKLREADKRVVFLSNAPRRAASIARVLAGMGIAPDLYTGIVTSGEAVYLGLRDRSGEFADLGRVLVHLGPPRDRNLFQGLDLTEIDTPADADFLLNTGPDDHHPPDDASFFDPLLNASLEAGLPMICANPDLEIVRDGKRIICAGLLAQIYQARGGRVIQRGKPDAAIYQPVMALLATDPARTLAVGDSLRTDIAGAKAAGIDAAWVLSGLHDLPLSDAPAYAAREGLNPAVILPAFRWT
ncbi:MAG TPA: TIGR01459 family HAD-type hydrolase [Acetobacteraceae bacterium]|nr:TIGR01459 family HAD-type hydrolase [Acetobacteraceae bacterium]